MEQLSLFDCVIPYPQTYDEIYDLYRNHIYDGELDDIAFTSKKKKDGMSYFFYGEKSFAFYPDRGKGPKFMICEYIGDKKKEIFIPQSEFASAMEKLKSRYQYLARNTITETFACCNDFKRCSASGDCIHPKEIFYNGCYYRTNLESGLNFYKED